MKVRARKPCTTAEGFMVTHTNDESNDSESKVMRNYRLVTESVCLTAAQSAVYLCVFVQQTDSALFKNAFGVFLLLTFTLR